jgi:hypothetical protein
MDQLRTKDQATFSYSTLRNKNEWGTLIPEIKVDNAVARGWNSVKLGKWLHV